MTIYMSLVYGVLYITFFAYPYAFVLVRGWDPASASLPFLALLVGILLACIALSVFTTTWYQRRFIATKRLNPEDRIPPIFVGSLLLPAGLFWFAWTSQLRSWVPQVLSGVLIGAGIILIYMSSIVYLIDVYLFNANSALAINTFVRSLVAAAFPLMSLRMYNSLGVEWATSLLGFLCVAMIPFPCIFWWYGRKIRSWEK